MSFFLLFADTEFVKLSSGFDFQADSRNNRLICKNKKNMINFTSTCFTVSSLFQFDLNTKLYGWQWVTGIWRYIGILKDAFLKLNKVLETTKMIWSATCVAEDADQWLLLWATVINIAGGCSVVGQGVSLKEWTYHGWPYSLCEWTATIYVYTYICIVAWKSSM